MKKVKNPRKDIFGRESPKYRFQISIVTSEDVENTVEKFLKRNLSSFQAAGYLKTVGVEPFSKTIEIDEKKIRLIFLLHSSEEEFSWVFKRSAKNSNALILIYSISNSKTLNNILEQIRKIRNIKSDIPIILVGNKSELEENREVSKEQLEEVKENYDISLLMEISLKTGENVEEMYRNVTTMLLQEYIYDRKKKRRLIRVTRRGRKKDF